MVLVIHDIGPTNHTTDPPPPSAPARALTSVVPSSCWEMTTLRSASTARPPADRRAGEAGWGAGGTSSKRRQRVIRWHTANRGRRLRAPPRTYPHCARRGCHRWQRPEPSRGGCELQQAGCHRENESRTAKSASETAACAARAIAQFAMCRGCSGAHTHYTAALIDGAARREGGWLRWDMPTCNDPPGTGTHRPCT